LGEVRLVLVADRAPAPVFRLDVARRRRAQDGHRPGDVMLLAA
jgi:hypothetical protein